MEKVTSGLYKMKASQSQVSSDGPSEIECVCGERLKRMGRGEKEPRRSRGGGEEEEGRGKETHDC